MTPFQKTDVKQARFHADSTPEDDELDSCMDLKCVIPVPPKQTDLVPKASSVPARSSERLKKRPLAEVSEIDDAAKSSTSKKKKAV